MYEEEVARGIREIGLPPAEEVLSPVSRLTEKDLKKMKVVKLRLMLRDRGLMQNENKSELATRMVEEIKNNVPVMSQEIQENLVFDAVFPAGTYWTLLEADDDVVDESEMFVEGRKFWVPTDDDVVEGNRGDPNRLRQRKRNYPSHGFDRPPFVWRPVLLPEKIRNRGGFKCIKTNNGSFGFSHSMSHEKKD